jgi:lipopolysaccharide transport system permease protein
LITLFRQCSLFRELLFALMRRDVTARYRGSLFGRLWIVLQPLLFLAVYYLVFSEFRRRDGAVSGAKFAFAMLAGLIPWIAFAESLGRGAGCILSNGSMIKKYAFPTEILPVYIAGVSLFNCFVGFVVISLGILIFEAQPPRMLWLFPIVLLLQGIFTLGLIYLLSSLTVFIRDLAQMLPMLITFWFFMSPIFMFAKAAETPQALQAVYRYNPASYFISVYREIFVWTPGDMAAMRGTNTVNEGSQASIALPHTDPGAVPWIVVGILAACAVVVLFLGLAVFRRLKPGFADEV